MDFNQAGTIAVRIIFAQGDQSGLVTFDYFGFPLNQRLKNMQV